MKNFSAHYDELKTWMGKLEAAIPDTMQGFNALHTAAIKDGAIMTKTKELIALGIAIAIRCDGCIAFHVHDALVADTTEEEIAETVSGAMVMGGGPAMMYGIEAMQATSQFMEQKAR